MFKFIRQRVILAQCTGFCKKFVGVEINSITNSDMHSHLIGFCKKFVGVEINSITNSDMHSHLIGKCWFTVNAEFLVGLSSPLLCSNTLDIDIVLRYIYGGNLSLEEYEPSDIIKILIAANELNLQELIPCLESFLIGNSANWIEQNFDLIFKTSFENDLSVKLQEYCTNLISNNPKKLFESLNVVSIPENLLISLIKNDNLQMSIHVWDYVIKWGLAQNPELSSDPTSYSRNDFNALKNTLQQCIPFIKFHNLTSKEFSKKVLPYKKILPKDLYNELLDDFLNNDRKPIKKPTTNVEKIEENGINSRIITTQHAELISKWINGQKSTDELEISYNFKLLYRESVDGFDRFKKFHEICDNQSHTVTVIKIRGSNEILGGHDFGSNIINNVLSHVDNEDKAIHNGLFNGPSFGDGDLLLFNDFSYDLMVRCTSQSYENQIKKPLTDTFGFIRIEKFEVDELEVFKII
ncbi:carbohydrate-binding module family 13 protein [Rhizophagus irregularis DAOM 181602=DAOM 197198]|nr:carbohydrate-binding module family 13 protein [Rhizophagus irregularis DAOM 181602=DAOM 197198]